LSSAQLLRRSSELIETRIGHRVIVWDIVTLERVLSQLRCRRDRTFRARAVAISEAGHDALIREAEKIKDNATQHHE
jgi:hypothetical protein